MLSSLDPRPIQDPYRAAVYRGVFHAAGLYNLAFGAWAGLDPSAFFHWMEIDPPRYPAIWQCLGMVVGLYGLAYSWAAERLELGRPLIAIGLLGKVLGPFGLIFTVQSGEWPLRTGMLCVFNDLVWWVPFGLYLLEGTRAGAAVRAGAVWPCVALHAIAAPATLFLLQGGSEVVPDAAQRIAYIRDHAVAWRAGWALWMLSAVSLLGFYAWWGARTGRPRAAHVALAIAAVGMGFDLFTEALYIGWLPRHFETIAPMGTLLSAGVANGLYSVAGVILTRSHAGLPRALRAIAWAVWVGGFGLTASALAGWVPGLVGFSAVIMTLFTPWCAAVGWVFREGRRPVAEPEPVPGIAPESSP